MSRRTEMNFSQSEQDFIYDNETYVPVRDEDKPRISSEDSLREAIGHRAPGGLLDMKHTVIKGLDLSGWDMRGLDLSRATFDGCNLNGTDFSGSKMDNVAF